MGFLLVPEKGLLKVVFLDIGQGDSIYIESPSGVQVLIDGGPNGAVLQELGSVMGFFDRDIDLVIATHPDKDHIAGLVEVFERYQVDSFGSSTVENPTVYEEALRKAVKEEPGLLEIPLVRGERVDLGDGVILEILFPDRVVSGIGSNTGSVVSRLTYGNTSFLLTGDTPILIEEFLVRECRECLRSTVLQGGHHGSKTSTGDLFLKAVSPEVVVFSAGKDNRYGHPAEEVVDRVKKTGAAIFGTYDLGQIFFVSDGERVWTKQ